MSTRTFSSKHRKESTAKYRTSVDKENNAYSAVVQNNKVFEGQNNGGQKKGLSLKTEHQAAHMTSVQNPSMNKTKFQIYFDGDKSDRSRSRVRKDVCRKEIRARQDSKKTIVPTTTVDSRVASRRARSSSNSRHNVPSDKIEMTNKLFCNRRAYSENRKTPDIRKSKQLTNDVKKRTFSSIQMWKDKMRKLHAGTRPKSINGNVLYIDKTRTETKLRNGSVTGSIDLQFKMSRNCATNLNENIEEPEVESLTDVLQFLSNKIALITENKSHFQTQTDTNMRNSISKNIQDNNVNATAANSNTSTTLDDSCLLLTSTKVSSEKRAMTKKSLEIDFGNIWGTIYVRDYLEDVIETERNKENNAPRLSTRFLRENVNAEQRRLIVGYVIRLGVHYHYPSYVIYQTIKLFNVVIDRILMETNDIQLITLACLWITLKQEIPDTKIPSATAILQLAKDLYINQEKLLLKYEKKILSAIKFNTRFADPFTLLSYYILNINRDSNYNIVKQNDVICIYFCGSYMIDLSMLDESLCDIPTYVITIAAVELSLYFVYSSDFNVNKWCPIWRRKHSLTEWEERVMSSTKRLMIQHAMEYDKFSSKVIYKKYTHSKHGEITNFLHDKLNTIGDVENIFKF